MFGFLNSALLVAAAAAVIPLLIHLFSKRKVKIIEFSSLKYLKQMQRKQVRRLKIRQLLLLLLRMLIILMVVMAFARPTSDESSFGSHASVSALIIFDNSSSMNRYVADGNLFEIAKNKTNELLDSFGEADEVLIIYTSPIDNEIKNSFRSVAIARENLNAAKTNNIQSNLTESFESGLSLLNEASNLNKEIYLISDLQQNSLANEKLLDSSKAKFFIVELPIESAENNAVVSIDLGGQLILPGQDFELTASIKNFSQSESSEIIVSLFLNGNRVSQTDVTLKPGEESSVSFKKSVAATGFHSGYVEISDDKYVSDNRRYFSFSIPDQFNALVIGDDIASQLFKLALVPSPSLNQYWSLKSVAPDKLSGVNFYDYDIIFLFNPTAISETYQTRIKNYVQTGMRVYINYSPDMDHDAYNKNWSNFSGVVVSEAAKKDFSRAGYYALSTIENSHPVFSVFDYKDNKPPEIKFYSLPKTKVASDLSVLAKFTGGRAALVEREIGKGKVMMFTAPLSPEYSDLSTHSFFVPFVSRLAEYLASDISSFDNELFCSRSIRRSLALDDELRSSVELSGPDSSFVYLTPQEEKGALIVDASPVSQSGVYLLKYLGREIDRFAVNAHPSESNLLSAPPEQMANALGTENYHFLESNNGKEMLASISELRFGKELWQIFLWITVLLVFFELFLARNSSREE